MPKPEETITHHGSESTYNYNFNMITDQQMITVVQIVEDYALLLVVSVMSTSLKRLESFGMNRKNVHFTYFTSFCLHPTIKR